MRRNSLSLRVAAKRTCSELGPDPASRQGRVAPDMKVPAVAVAAFTAGVIGAAPGVVDLEEGIAKLIAEGVPNCWRCGCRCGRSWTLPRPRSHSREPMCEGEGDGSCWLVDGTCWRPTLRP